MVTRWLCGAAAPRGGDEVCHDAEPFNKYAGLERDGNPEGSADLPLMGADTHAKSGLHHISIDIGMSRRRVSAPIANWQSGCGVEGGE